RSAFAPRSIARARRSPNGSERCPAIGARSPSMRGDVEAAVERRASSKMRLDALLAERGLFETRSRAAASVLAGEVRIGAHGTRATKPGTLVALDVELAVDEVPRFVSRGGIKLANALASSGLEVAGRRCLDVGASTGGFTACLLASGGAAVVALDVGYGELGRRAGGGPPGAG